MQRSHGRSTPPVDVGASSLEHAVAGSSSPTPPVASSSAAASSLASASNAPPGLVISVDSAKPPTRWPVVAAAVPDSSATAMRRIPEGSSSPPLVSSPFAFDAGAAAARAALQLISQHAMLQQEHALTTRAMAVTSMDKSLLLHTAQLHVQQITHTHAMLTAAQQAERDAEKMAEKQTREREQLAATNAELRAQLRAAKSESERAAAEYRRALREIEQKQRGTQPLSPSQLNSPSPSNFSDREISFSPSALTLSDQTAVAPIAATAASAGSAAASAASAFIDPSEHARVLSDLASLLGMHASLTREHTALREAHAATVATAATNADALRDAAAARARIAELENGLELQDETHALLSEDVAATKSQLLEQLAEERRARVEVEMQLAQAQSQKIDMASDLSEALGRLERSQSKQSALLIHESASGQTMRHLTELQALLQATQLAYDEARARNSKVDQQREMMRQRKEEAELLLEKREKENAALRKRLRSALQSCKALDSPVLVGGEDSSSKWAALSASTPPRLSPTSSSALVVLSPPAPLTTGPFSPSRPSPLHPTHVDSLRRERQLQAEFIAASDQLNYLDHEAHSLRSAQLAEEKRMRAKQQKEKQQKDKLASDAAAAAAAAASASSPLPTARSQASELSFASPSSLMDTLLDSTLVDDLASPSAVAADATSSALSSLRRDFSDLSREYQSLQDELDACQQLYAEALQERGEALEGQVGLEGRVAELQGALETLRRSEEASRTNSDQTVRQLRTQIQELRAIHAQKELEFEMQIRNVQQKAHNAEATVKQQQQQLQQQQRDHLQQQEQQAKQHQQLLANAPYRSSSERSELLALVEIQARTLEKLLMKDAEAPP